MTLIQVILINVIIVIDSPYSSWARKNTCCVAALRPVRDAELHWTLLEMDYTFPLLLPPIMHPTVLSYGLFPSMPLPIWSQIFRFFYTLLCNVIMLLL
jgi:hypothetical protein